MMSDAPVMSACGPGRSVGVEEVKPSRSIRERASAMTMTGNEEGERQARGGRRAPIRDEGGAAQVVGQRGLERVEDGERDGERDARAPGIADGDGTAAGAAEEAEVVGIDAHGEEEEGRGRGRRRRETLSRSRM